ncbi:DUF4129 domain-containing protein [Brachybacterium hainanense]|uniref:DUF4129 domain-containing protein n=1 Tax=Brachybacterium hainanense TaxID=1541174 RepID=A0ABV6RE46_9MICO
MSAGGTTESSPSAPEPEERGRRAPRSWAPLVLLIGIVCLLLLALASTRSDLVLATFDPPRPTASTTATAEESEETREAPEFTPPELPEPTEPGVGADVLRAVIITLAIIGGLGLLLLILWIIQRTLALRRRAQRAVAAEDEDLDVLTAAQAAEAIDDAVVQLTRTARPGDAVIAAWLALQGAIARTGIRRGPTQTTQEFVVAVLGALDLDRTDLESFAALYGQALFSGEPITEEDRDTALSLLTRLSGQLSARAGGTA